MTIKYRIKSYHLGNDVTKAVFTVEEVDGEGEMRISAQDILANKPLLYDFDKQDIVCIVYTAASEQAVETIGFN